MNKKYLILEGYDPKPVAITKKTDKNIRFIATLQEANKPNRNKRIYTKSAIDAALKGPLVQEKIKSRSWLMEVGHPAIKDLARQRNVELNNFCALIEDYWWEGNSLKARCLTLDNPSGQYLKSLIEVGGLASFSMRGTGDVKQDPVTGLSVVGEGLQITTYDWVYIPSHPEAYMDSLCEEVNQRMYNIQAYDNSTIALQESLDVYENGKLIELNEISVPNPTLDYTKKYYDKYKKLDEMYQYSDGDKITATSENLLSVTVFNESDNSTKQVMTEDFVIKGIRHKLASIINEACEEAVKDEVKCQDCQKSNPEEAELKTPETDEFLGTQVDTDDIKTQEDELNDLTKDQITESTDEASKTPEEAEAKAPETDEFLGTEAEGNDVKAQDGELEDLTKDQVEDNVDESIDLDTMSIAEILKDYNV